MATIGASGPVVSSLPGNVLINDQLTPTRSQIEASTGFVPLDIGMAANFTTDDRTALALHISAKYGTLADYQGGRYVEALAAMIIQNRKKSKVAPLTIYGETQASELYKVLASEKLPVPPNSAAFQAHWSEQLQQANQAVKDHLSQ
jgi:hypothetical protein